MGFISHEPILKHLNYYSSQPKMEVKEKEDIKYARNGGTDSLAK